MQERILRVIELAQVEADRDPAFFTVKGPGAGDRATAIFINALRHKAKEEFGSDLAECPVLPGTGVKVDYWMPEEGVIVEVALSLRHPLSEFERDILKAVIARERGLGVSALVFITKSGGAKRLRSPWFSTVIEWAKGQGIEVSVHELESRAA